MDGATVKRWQRYGHDRLYVTDTAGRRLGWACLKERRIEASNDADRAMIEAAVRDHTAWQSTIPPEHQRSGEPHPAPPPPPMARPAAGDPGPVTVQERPEQPAAAASIEAPWVDLAQKKAGQDLAALAAEERAARPVRTTLARVLGVHTQERAWRVGAAGERSLAKELAKLDDSWKVLHAVPVGDRNSDIDHVVIGPPGVFTINTKHHPDAKVWVGGDTVMIGSARVPYIRNSRYEATRTRQLLSAATGIDVPVVGVVAVICRDLTIKARASDVVVTYKHGLRPWLKSLGPALEPDTVAAIYEKARRSTTWRRSSP